MADESEEEFESAESETELTEKDITKKFPAYDSEKLTKTPGPKTSSRSENDKEIEPEQETHSEESSKETTSKDSQSQKSDKKTTEQATSAVASATAAEDIPEKSSVTEPTETPSNEKKAVEKNSEKQEPQSSGGWGWGWGSIGTLLSSSVSAVSDSAQSISKGIGSIVTNVEDALGVPQPEDMVREPPESEEDKKQTVTAENDTEKNVASNSTSEEEKPVEGKKSDDDGSQMSPTDSAGIGGFLSGITAAVQSTGMELMSGGLDALEAIGRKTVDIISEGDPGLRNKRALLSGKTTLSQVLREAKEEAENAKEMAVKDGGDFVDCTLNYSILFDQYEGLVHLEALELLSKECANKVRTSLTSYSGKELEDRNQKIEKLDQYFQEPAEDNAEGKPKFEGTFSDVPSILGDLGKKIKVEKLMKASEQAREKISQFGSKQSENPEESKTNEKASNIKDYHDAGLHMLAELSSLTIELLKKSAELILVQNVVFKDEHEIGQMFQKVTALVCLEFESITALLADKLSQETSDEADSLITSLYLEASNSSSYIQDALGLLQPVLQLKALESMETTTNASNSSLTAESPTPNNDKEQ